MELNESLWPRPHLALARESMQSSCACHNVLWDRTALAANNILACKLRVRSVHYSSGQNEK